MSEELPIVRSPEGEYLGSYSPTEGVSFTRKPNTRVRLHELGHKLLGHTGGEMTLGKFIDQELEAEAYSYRQMDRPVTYKIARPVTYELVTDFEFLPLQAVGTAVRGLQRIGINPSKDEQDELYVIALEGRRRQGNVSRSR